MLRNLETWLHQHIFKVGWLVTKDYQTTTILYYTLFLPGVALYEISYWLMAGILNVRAERAIKWPEAQEIGELKLNFVNVAKKTNRVQLAIINTAPLVVSLVIIWFIAQNIFDIEAVVSVMSTGQLADVAAGLRLLLNAPDFWIWFYLTFAISNTMMPNFQALSGWRAFIPVIVVVVAVLTIIGVADEIVVGFLSGPVTTALQGLSSVFAVMIAVNIISVGVLSIIENTIELITGDSADFRNGKMVTMTRAERLEQRERSRQRARQARERRRAPREPAGSPTIYNVSFPIPGSPDDVEVTALQKVMVDDEEAEKPTLETGRARARAGADLIAAQVEPDDSPEAKDRAEEKTALSQPQLPSRFPGQVQADSEEDAPEDMSEADKAAAQRSSPFQPGTSSTFGARFPQRPASAEDADKTDSDPSEAASKPNQPAASRPSRFPQRPASDPPADSDKAASADSDKPAAQRSSPFRSGSSSTFGARFPQRPASAEDADKADDDPSETASKPNQPAASRPSRFPQRPASDPPADSDKAASADSDKPAAQRSSPFRSGSSSTFGARFPQRPASAEDADKTDDDPSETASKADQPAASRPSPFRSGSSSTFGARFPQRPASAEDADKADDDPSETASKPNQPAASRPSPFRSGSSSTFGARFPQRPASAEDADKADDDPSEAASKADQPAASRPSPLRSGSSSTFGARFPQRPASAEDVDKTDSNPSEAASKPDQPAASRPSPFRTSSTSAFSSRFSQRSTRPSERSADTDDEDDIDELEYEDIDDDEYPDEDFD